MTPKQHGARASTMAGEGSRQLSQRQPPRVPQSPLSAQKAAMSTWASSKEKQGSAQRTCGLREPKTARPSTSAPDAAHLSGSQQGPRHFSPNGRMSYKPRSRSSPETIKEWGQKDNLRIWRNKLEITELSLSGKNNSFQPVERVRD